MQTSKLPGRHPTRPELCGDSRVPGAARPLPPARGPGSARRWAFWPPPCSLGAVGSRPAPEPPGATHGGAAYRLEPSGLCLTSGPWPGSARWWASWPLPCPLKLWAVDQNRSCRGHTWGRNAPPGAVRLCLTSGPWPRIGPPVGLLAAALAPWGRSSRSALGPQELFICY